MVYGKQLKGANVGEKPIEFPAFVPEEVRRNAKWILYGDISGIGKDGSIGLVERLQTRLNEVDSSLHNTSETSAAASAVLRKKKQDLARQVEELSLEIDCLRRLTSEAGIDMKDAYALLTEHLVEADQVWLFIYSAASAQTKFSPYRTALRASQQVKKRIAESALELAGLLEKFDDLKIHAPDEFFSVRDLIQKSLNSAHEVVAWNEEGQREMVTDSDGSTESELESLGGDDSTEDQDIPDGELEILEYVGGEQPESIRFANNAGFHWHDVPPLASLLRTLSDSANDFDPQEDGYIAAALASRKNDKTAMYIRGFGHLLELNGIPLTPPIKRAMAITATVVLNDPDVALDFENIRKALA